MRRGLASYSAEARSADDCYFCCNEAPNAPYEIPIDSRVRKRLKELGFAVQDSLGSNRSYCRVMDDIQELCKACGVLPCVLDAAMFASFDEGGWTEDIVKDVF